MLVKQPKGATENRKKSSGWLSLLWMLVGAILAVMVGVFAYLSPFFDFGQQDTPSTTAVDYQVQPKVNPNTDNTDYEFYDVLPSQEMVTIPDASVIEEDNKDKAETLDPSFKPDVVVEQQRRLEEAAKRQLQEQQAQTQQQQAAQTDPANDDKQDGNYGISEQTMLNPEDNNPANDNNANAVGSRRDNSNNQAETANDGKSSASIQRSQPATTYILQINSFGSADEADRRRAQVLMAGVDARVVKNVTGNGQEIYQVISVATSNRNAVALAQQRLQNNGIDSIIVEQRRK